MCLVCDIMNGNIVVTTSRGEIDLAIAACKVAMDELPQPSDKQQVMIEFTRTYGPWECTDDQRERVAQLLVESGLMSAEELAAITMTAELLRRANERGDTPSG